MTRYCSYRSWCVDNYTVQKEALIQAMLERLIQYDEWEIAQHQRHDTEPGRWTRAYVRKTVEPMMSYPGEAEFPKSKEVSAALLAAVATNAKLLEPLQERFRAWQLAIEHAGLPQPTTAMRGDDRLC